MLRQTTRSLALAGVLLFGTAVNAAEPPTAGKTTLAEAKQQAIWDLESATFAFENYFGKPFVADLAADEAAGASRWLTDGFKGTVFAEEATPRVLQAGPVEERRWSSETQPTREVDAATAFSWLRERARRFGDFRKNRFHITRIHRSKEDPSRWDVDVLFKMLGTDRSGRSLEIQMTGSATMRAKDLEAIKTATRQLQSLKIDSEKMRLGSQVIFSEATSAWGLDQLPMQDNWTLPAKRTKPYRFQIAVADFDRDDYLDVVVGSLHGQYLLLRNVDGKKFEEVTFERGLSWTEDAPRGRAVQALAAWIDVDDDGWPDLLLGGKFYKNEEGRFVDRTKQSGLSFQRAPSAAVVADYDGDGDLDLYLVNQVGYERRAPGPRPWVGDPAAGTENHLWLNDGKGTFRNVTQQANASAGKHQSFAASTFFFDDDAYPDLYLANDFGANVLLRNRGDGTFEDVTRSADCGDFATSMGVASGDIDNDGQVELYVANMYSKMGRRIVDHIAPDDYLPGIHGMLLGSLAGSRLYRREDANGRYRDISTEVGINKVGWAYAPTLTDFDGDGFLDIYATAGYISHDRDAGDG